MNVNPFSRFRLKSGVAMISLGLFGLAGESARADLVFSNLNLTSGIYSVDVSGVMPSVPPLGGTGRFTFAVPDSGEAPGGVECIVIGFAGEQNFTGTQVLDFVTTTFDSPWQYSPNFASPLTPGESFNGTLSWTAHSGLPPYSAINVYWGDKEDGILLAGNLPVQASPVPEASSALLLALPLGLLALCRRRS